MPVGETGLPVDMAAAEEARMQRSIARMQERVASRAAVVPPEDRGREDVGDRVKAASGVAGATLQGGGTPSFPPGKEGRKQEPEPAGEMPPDPHGRGRALDVEG